MRAEIVDEHGVRHGDDPHVFRADHGQRGSIGLGRSPGAPVSCCFALPWAGVPRRMQSELFRPGYERVKVARRNVAFLLQSPDFSYGRRLPVRPPHLETFRRAGVIAGRYSVSARWNMAAKGMTEIVFDLPAESFRPVSNGFLFVFCRVTGRKGRKRRTGAAP